MIQNSLVPQHMYCHFPPGSGTEFAMFHHVPDIKVMYVCMYVKYDERWKPDLTSYQDVQIWNKRKYENQIYPDIRKIKIWTSYKDEKIWRDMITYEEIWEPDKTRYEDD